MEMIPYVNDFAGVLRSEMGREIANAVLRSVIPKGLQTEVVRRFNVYVGRNNDIIEEEVENEGFYKNHYQD